MHTPLEIVREVYARWVRCDYTGLFDLFATNIEITQAARLPGGQRFTGLMGASDFLLSYRRHLRIEPEPRLYIPSGREIVVFGRLHGRTWSSRRPVDLDFVHVWSITDAAVRSLRVIVDVAAMAAVLESRQGV